ncbi:arylsulfatase [Bacteroides intestinalis CAG:315]|jgi:arylsulfatase A-like enzyme|nr:arylsulfatase [Bacteroides intestinalis CAG:315]
MRKSIIALTPLMIAPLCWAQEKPNVVIFLVDDMGYSDIGCYGGEIMTPNLDKLASTGVRFTQFYNTSRSCPARASLMTGLYQHQAGIGQMSEDPGTFKKETQRDINDWGSEGYQGYLNRNCVTIAEVLKENGYHTYMAGKWHLGMHGQEKWPLQRGFERFYGILAGAASYLRPEGGRGLTLDNEHLPAPEAPYYTTDAFTDHALQFVGEQKDDKPFFLYLAFNAPHWPLQAKEEDIQKFTKLYRSKGWDKIRQERYNRMQKMGIIDKNVGFAEWENRSWDELTEKEKDESAYRMAVYAAQVHCVDYNVGKVIDYLKKTKQLDNTLILFLADNGACAEPYLELGGGKQEDINNPACNNMPSYGRAWAQTSNTPFRKYKCRSYEGGISTPLIFSWNKKLGNRHGNLCTTPGYLPDIMPTVLEATGAAYPETYHGGNKIHPLVGTSLFPAITEKVPSLHEYMYWEHQGNRAIRYGNWKAIRDEAGTEWELYDIVKDRTEKNNLASQHPDVLKKLRNEWEYWAIKHNVLPKHQDSPMLFADTTRTGWPFSKDPHVIPFHGKYLMYYSVPPKGNSGWGIGIAESTDLTQWKPIGSLSPAADYEAKGLCAPGALVRNDTIHLFYQTYGNDKKDAICHAWSVDGVNFTRNATNPIFAPKAGDWNCGRAIDAEVIFAKGKYFLYYATRTPDYVKQIVGVATAPAGTNFNRETWTEACDRAILVPEWPWEETCIEAPSVVEMNGTLYMFYAGAYNNRPQQIGLATSTDGIHWRKVSNKPFLANGDPRAWNYCESGHPHIFKDKDGQTYLFYQGNEDFGRTWFLSQRKIIWRDGFPQLK